MDKKTIILSLILVFLVLMLGVLAFLLSGQSAQAPQEEGDAGQALMLPSADETTEALPEDNTAVIEEDLEAIDFGDLEGEFGDIDEDIEQL